VNDVALESYDKLKSIFGLGLQLCLNYEDLDSVPEDSS